QALLAELGEPILSSTLLLPGEEEPMTEGWLVKDELDQLLDAVIEGESGSLPTTVVDLTSGAPEVTRYGAGDPSPCEQSPTSGGACCSGRAITRCRIASTPRQSA